MQTSSAALVGATCLALLTFRAPSQGVGQYLEAGVLSATSPAPSDELGHSTAIRGDLAVVGVPQVGTGIGAAHVFRRTGANWTSMTQIAVLTPSDGGIFDRFGAAVAIDGDTIVVGAPGHDIGGSVSEGAAYVFVEPPTGWVDATEDARLVSAVRQSTANFGFAVAVAADTVVVGAPSTNTLAGAAYVYEEPVGGWVDATENAKLTASNQSVFEQFGASVAIDGSTAVAASPGLTGGGAAYVFEKPPAGWTSGTETAKLTASTQAAAQSVAIDGDVVVFGGAASVFALLGPNAFAASGAVYVFPKPPGGWANGTESAILTASDGRFGDYLGDTLALRGGTLVVGAPRKFVGGPLAGRVYVFEEPGSGWVNSVESAQLAAFGSSPLAEFGFAVAVDGAVLVGAPKAGSAVGAAYVYESPTLLPGSGCGLPVVNLSGGKRIGTTLQAAFSSCSPEATAGFVLGTPQSEPVRFPASVPCGDVRACLLSCAPAAVLQGASVSLVIENDPALVGATLCVQGVCFEPAPCVRITDMSSFVISN